MAKRVQLQLRGCDIRQVYTLHDSPLDARRAVDGTLSNTLATIAILHRGDVYYDTIPRGQPLPVNSVTLTDREAKQRYPLGVTDVERMLEPEDR